MTSIAPDLAFRTRVRLLHFLLETIKLSKSTPTTFAYLGSKACSTSTKTTITSISLHFGYHTEAEGGLPEDSGPYISTILQGETHRLKGKSIAKDPVNCETPFLSILVHQKSSKFLFIP